MLVLPRYGLRYDGVQMNQAPHVSMSKKTQTGQHRRGIYLLPNLFTTAALFSGFYAIVAAMHSHFEPAAIAIFVAMLLDGIDGRVARMTNTQSFDFGPSMTACRTWSPSGWRRRW